MNSARSIAGLVLAGLLTACGGGQAPVADNDSTAADAKKAAIGELVQIAPGLSKRILNAGDGEQAEAGDLAIVHYTGWLHDTEAENNRGQKFDSSRDRGDPFRFILGAQQVIRGWDEGVATMRVGEVSELILQPEMGYGDRGAGNAIPPGATLLFEVSLEGLEGRPDSN